MAKESSGFFDSVNRDRLYNAADFSNFFKLITRDGIDGLQVTPVGTGLQVYVDYGRAQIQGHGYWLENNGTGKKTMTLDPAESLPRIDWIILRLDTSLPERRVSLQIKKGISQAVPVAPELTQNGGNTYELPLARITVSAGLQTLTGANIMDYRTELQTLDTLYGLIRSVSLHNLPYYDDYTGNIVESDEYGLFYIQDIRSTATPSLNPSGGQNYSFLVFKTIEIIPPGGLTTVYIWIDLYAGTMYKMGDSSGFTPFPRIVCRTGSTAARPASPKDGEMYLDTSLNGGTPIWWSANRNAWINGVGTAV